MKPVLIIEHEAGVSAGHFASWLRGRSLAFEPIAVHEGDPLPATAAHSAGICSLGGNMSVNDPLPWIAGELALLRDAIARGVPVIGHCLGGQLLAAALGAAVTRNRFKEMGWLPVSVEDKALVREWLGADEPGELFHWHGDVFALPDDARRLLSSPLAPNQAFIAERNGVAHVGMQFHIEMTPELVTAWTSDPAVPQEIAEEIEQTGGPGVQSPQAMRRDLARRTARMKTLAWRLYDRWASALSN